MNATTRSPDNGDLDKRTAPEMHIQTWNATGGAVRTKQQMETSSFFRTSSSSEWLVIHWTRLTATHIGLQCACAAIKKHHTAKTLISSKQCNSFTRHSQPLLTRKFSTVGPSFVRYYESLRKSEARELAPGEGRWGSNNPPEIYLGVKRGISRFKKNIFSGTQILVLIKAANETRLCFCYHL